MSRILIVKHLGIGDIIMTLPAYFYLVNKYGVNNVDWLADYKMKYILENFMPKDNILCLDTRLLHQGIFGKIKFLIVSNLMLIGKRYSRIYILHGHFLYFLTAILKFWAARSCLSFRFGRQSLIRGRYLGLNHFNYVSNEDGPIGSFNSYYNQAVDHLNALINETQIFSQKKGTDYAVFCLGLGENLGDSTSTRRRVKMSLWIELAVMIKTRGLNVIVLCGPGDDKILENAFKNCDVALVKERSFIKIASLLRSAKIVVTTDNGMFHLACLSGAKTLALFGPTLFSERCPPVGANVMIYTNPRAPLCVPCFDGQTVYNCSENLCLSNILVSEVESFMASAGFI